MKKTHEYKVVDSVETLEEAIAKVRAAQRKYATYTQEQVDRIFLAAATAANAQRIPLAQMAVEETGMGVVEDKVIKNHYAAEYIYNAYKEYEDLRRHRRGQGVWYQQHCRADRRDCSGHPDHEPDFYRHL